MGCQVILEDHVLTAPTHYSLHPPSNVYAFSFHPLELPADMFREAPYVDAALNRLSQGISPYELSKGTIRIPYEKPASATLIGKIAKFKAAEDAAHLAAKKSAPKKASAKKAPKTAAKKKAAKRKA